MKILSCLFFIPFLSVSMCGGEGDDCEGGKNYNFETDNLITVQSASHTFQVGDTLWINSVVNKNQVDVTGNAITIFDITDKLQFAPTYERVSAYGQYLQIQLGQEYLVPDKGALIYGTFILDKEGDNFVNRTGIKLLEAGNFRITANGLDSYKEDSKCSDPHVGIFTHISNADVEGSYLFSVE